MRNEPKGGRRLCGYFDPCEDIVDEAGHKFGGVLGSHGLARDHVGAHVLFEEFGHVVDGLACIECVGHECGNRLVPQHRHLAEAIGVGGVLADDEQAMNPGADADKVGGRYFGEVQAVPWAHEDIVASGSELAADVFGCSFGVARSAAVGHENIHVSESTTQHCKQKPPWWPNLVLTNAQVPGTGSLGLGDWGDAGELNDRMTLGTGGFEVDLAPGFPLEKLVRIHNCLGDLAGGDVIDKVLRSSGIGATDSLLRVRRSNQPTDLRSPRWTRH